MSSINPSLLVVETHPVQYRAPVYRALQARWGVKVHVIYGSDFSIAGYFDKHFQSSFAWDVDLLSGIESSTFLQRSAQGGAASMEEISAKGMGRAIRHSSADAVLITGYYPVFHLQALYHAKALRRPLLFRAETIDLPTRSGVKGRLRSLFLRQLYGLCARVLPIGKLSYNHYRRLGVPEEKLILSPYCVDSTPLRWDEDARKELRSSTRAELGIADDRIVIVFSGKIYAHKRPGLLLNAIRLLPEPYRGRVEVLFLGSGPDLEAVRGAALIEPAIRVTCTGFQRQSQMSRYYHASDLLVLPSVSETWGLVVNEALLHGIPCVVTDTVGSGPDLIHSGVTGEVALGTPEGLADAILQALKLIGNPLVRSQCRMAVEGYSVEKAADGIFQAFQESTKAPAGSREQQTKRILVGR